MSEQANVTQEQLKALTDKIAELESKNKQYEDTAFTILTKRAGKKIYGMMNLDDTTYNGEQRKGLRTLVAEADKDKHNMVNINACSYDEGKKMRIGLRSFKYEPKSK